MTHHTKVSNTVGVVRASPLVQVKTQILVRPNDLDSLGHVNNAVVLEYLEAGRWAWLSHNHLPRKGRIIPVVARIEIDYRREILPPEVTVTTILEDAADVLTSSYVRFKCVFRQTVASEQESASVLAIEAQVQVAFVDVTDRGIRSLQDYLNQSTEESCAGLESFDGTKK